MHIAIAGGGIAGLSAAVALARRGHSITLSERASQFSETGAGIQIGPNGMRALAALGVADAVAAAAVRPAQLLVHDGSSGGLIASSALGDSIESRFGAPWLTVLRADLLNALVAAAHGLPDIELNTASAVTGYYNRANGIEAMLADGSSLAADVLLGADGIRSTVRARMLGDGGPADNGLAIYRALIASSEAPDWARLPDVHLWLLPRGHMVHYPVAAGASVNIVAMTESRWTSEDWSMPASSAEATAPFAAAAPTLAEVLKRPAHWLKWAGADRPPAPRWSDGRALLIGDAAHPVLPCLAQGAVMALEDAVVLARLLPPEAADPRPALAEFEAKRHARTARVQAASRQQARIYHLGGPARLARDAVLKSLLSGDRLTGRTAWLYRWRP